jgi:hypothetical protein
VFDVQCFVVSQTRRRRLLHKDIVSLLSLVAPYEKRRFRTPEFPAVAHASSAFTGGADNIYLLSLSDHFDVKSFPVEDSLDVFS